MSSKRKKFFGFVCFIILIIATIIGVYFTRDAYQTYTTSKAFSYNLDNKKALEFMPQEFREDMKVDFDLENKIYYTINDFRKDRNLEEFLYGEKLKNINYLTNVNEIYFDIQKDNQYKDNVGVIFKNQGLIKQDSTVVMNYIFDKGEDKDQVFNKVIYDMKKNKYIKDKDTKYFAISLIEFKDKIYVSLGISK